MASGTVYDAIKGYLEAQWTTTTIAWENESFTKPEPPAAWLMVEMTGDLYAQMSIGAGVQSENRWDEEGVLLLHVYVPSGTGASTARAYAKSLADLFRGALLLDDSLEFLDASIGMGQPGDDDGMWWRISVSVDWRRMEA
jgi:hypothetical protein